MIFLARIYIAFTTPCLKYQSPKSSFSFISLERSEGIDKTSDYCKSSPLNIHACARLLSGSVISGMRLLKKYKVGLPVSKFVPIYAMKINGNVEVHVPSFFTSALDGGERSSSYPSQFTPGTYRIGSWVVPRPCLDTSRWGDGGRPLFLLEMKLQSFLVQHTVTERWCPIGLQTKLLSLRANLSWYLLSYQPDNKKTTDICK